MSESGALRVVVDTNLFVRGTINLEGRPRRLLRAWNQGRFDLLLSEQQHVDLLDVFRRSKIIQNYRLRSEDLADLFARLAAAPRVVPSPSIPLSLRDPKDEPIFAAALGGNAD